MNVYPEDNKTDKAKKKKRQVSYLFEKGSLSKEVHRVCFLYFVLRMTAEYLSSIGCR